MVEYTLSLDSIFSSLADPTRRDILRRLINQELTISEIARPYDLTFAAISKHLKVLERAQLIIKRRRGKEQMVQVSPFALKDAANYLESYRMLWDERFQSLDKLLKQM
jgi:DNA-binding transcriptional ArsR family regulator